MTLCWLAAYVGLQELSSACISKMWRAVQRSRCKVCDLRAIAEGLYSYRGENVVIGFGLVMRRQTGMKPRTWRLRRLKRP
jgi:hypothetical protein